MPSLVNNHDKVVYREHVMSTLLQTATDCLKGETVFSRRLVLWGGGVRYLQIWSIQPSVSQWIPRHTHKTRHGCDYNCNKYAPILLEVVKRVRFSGLAPSPPSATGQTSPLGGWRGELVEREDPRSAG